jgi:uncharacterized repeat protein (TIGR03803 family)
LTTLVNFNGTNRLNLLSGLIGDADGNLFGTTAEGEAYDFGTVFEVAETGTGYANTPSPLVSFRRNGIDGGKPPGDLIADADSNLLGTTMNPEARLRVSRALRY